MFKIAIKFDEEILVLRLVKHMNNKYAYTLFGS
jgi:hypothetical protein